MGARAKARDGVSEFISGRRGESGQPAGYQIVAAGNLR
jgi:hypothetical protein